MELDKVTDEKIILIQNKLNNRPRKLLGYKTPNEVYDAMCLVASLSGVARATEIRGLNNDLVRFLSIRHLRRKMPMNRRGWVFYLKPQGDCLF